MSRAAGMKSLKLILAGCIATVAFSATAHAADPAWRRPPPLEEDAAPRYRELASGWYLRGDIGYRLNKTGSIDAPLPVIEVKSDSAISGTFGAGYKYNWFRADFTLDGTSPWQINATTATGRQPEYTQKVTWRMGLANAYLDMGTWAGFTPYVGGGVGIAQTKNQVFVDQTQVGSRGKSSNIAWAAMAGIAYQVSPSWVIDVGYRYLSLGNLAKPDGAGLIDATPRFNNLTSQEVRIGFRYLLD
jgi:opacity protein-like surface antigen